MAIDVDSREQRLRKQAERQSLSVYLANLRERENTYIQAAAVVPELLVNQINEMRQEIQKLEEELLRLQDESIDTPARRFYRDAFEAELAGDLDNALKLYKSASRATYPDASAAIRSVRYNKMKGPRGRLATAGRAWSSTSARQAQGRLLFGLVLVLILILLGALVLAGYFLSAPAAVVEQPTATPTPPAVVLIVPETSTPVATATPAASPTLTPTPTVVPQQVAAPVIATATPTLTPMPTATLRPAPRIIDPQNGLTWGDGTIVFEFEDLRLADDELYCVNTLRGYDKTNTENWSFPPVGSQQPRIPIEANVFRVAKTQGMRCIVWTAGIGKGSCENLISQVTEERMIGLPQMCRFQ